MKGFSFLCYTVAWFFIAMIAIGFLSGLAQSDWLEESIEEQRVRFVLERWSPVIVEVEEHDRDKLIVALHWDYYLTIKGIYEDIIVRLCQSHLQEVIDLKNIKGIFVFRISEDLSQFKGYAYVGGVQNCENVVSEHKGYAHQIVYDYTNWALLKYTHPLTVKTLPE